MIRAVGVETGGSNVQFAVNPQTEEILVIEMNPRVSRSSALASKATGFPIAKIAARLAVGYRLEEIDNDITGVTPACFEPTIDYVVVKWPRFAFEKFPGVELDADHAHEVRRRGDGDRAHVRARRSPRRCARASWTSRRAWTQWPTRTCWTACRSPAPTATRRSSSCCAAARRVEAIHARTSIDPWFLRELRRAGDRARGAVRGRAHVSLGRHLRRRVPGAHPLLLLRLGASARRRRPAAHEVARGERPSVVILGAGPNRIGQGIEFDYCCVHAAMTVRESGRDAVMINCNPETVSTDYDTSDRLYFEPLTLRTCSA